MKTKEKKNKVTCVCGKVLKTRGAHLHQRFCEKHQSSLKDIEVGADEPTIPFNGGSFEPHELYDVPSFHVPTETVEIVQAFDAAVRRHEMIGSKMPEEHEEIEVEYAKAKMRLYLHLLKLENDL